MTHKIKCGEKSVKCRFWALLFQESSRPFDCVHHDTDMFYSETLFNNTKFIIVNTSN